MLSYALVFSIFDNTNFTKHLSKPLCILTQAVKATPKVVLVRILGERFSFIAGVGYIERDMAAHETYRVL